VWKSVGYDVSKELDTAYWGFLGVGTTVDIFHNIILISYLEYGVLSPLDTAYRSLFLSGLWQGAAGQARVVKCYNCQEEGAYLDPKQLAFLADNGVTIVPAQASQEMPTPIAFQTEDLDAFDFNCDDVPSAKAVLMANLSSYDSNVLSEVIVDRNAKVADFEKQIHSLKLQLNATVESHKTLSTTVECLKKESKQKEDKYLNEVIDLQNENKALDNVVYKMGQSTQTMHMLTKPQAFYDESHKTTLGYQNPFYLFQDRRKVPALYDGHTIVKTHDALSVTDTEETLELAKESRPYHNQDAPKVKEFFIINELQAQLKAKNVSIEKLKEHIANIKGKNVVENYLKHTQENADILCEIIEHARDLRPMDSDFDSACKFVTRIQESLVYVSATCPSSKHVSDKLVAVTPINRTRKVRFAESKDTSKDKTLTRIQPQEKQTTNNAMSPSTGVSNYTEASGSKPGSNTKKDRITQTSICNANVKHFVLNVNSELIVLPFVKSRSTKSNKKKMWKPTGKVYTNVGYSWKPTGQTFIVVRNTCLLTRIISTKVVSPRKSISKTPVKQTQPSSNKSGKLKDVKHVGSSSQSKTVGTVRFKNDQIAKIMGYGDYQLGNVTISRVYYVEGLRHNLFFVDGADLLSGSRDTNLYTISLDDMLKSSPICLLSKASKTKRWLWHRRLSHLNFGTLNQLAKQCLVRGLPKLKFEKDHLCSACSLGKSKKSSHKSKADDTNQEKLYLLHMDLCGLMRVESINEKKYILVIIDDYLRFMWVKFLRSKDEAPEVILKCLKQIQVRMNATIRNIRTDNGTEFVNHTLKDYYENVEISHQTSVARTSQQNGVVEK
ncbi:retrovirus-related pol polyprotein from transposon TNT 1-94, partial [Tanacetum coccineum]